MSIASRKYKDKSKNKSKKNSKSRKSEKNKSVINNLVIAMLLGASAGAYLSYSKKPSRPSRPSQKIAEPARPSVETRNPMSEDMKKRHEEREREVTKNTFFSELLTLRNPGVKYLTLESETTNALGEKKEFYFPVYSHDPYVISKKHHIQGFQSTVYQVCFLECQENPKMHKNLFIKKKFGGTQLQNEKKAAEKEAFVYLKLADKNIVPKIYDYYIYGGDYYLILEMFDPFEPNSNKEARERLKDILLRLTQYGVIHDDVKLNNFVVHTDENNRRSLRAIDFSNSYLKKDASKSEWRSAVEGQAELFNRSSGDKNGCFSPQDLEDEKRSYYNSRKFEKSQIPWEESKRYQERVKRKCKSSIMMSNEEVDRVINGLPWKEERMVEAPQPSNKKERLRRKRHTRREKKKQRTEEERIEAERVEAENMAEAEERARLEKEKIEAERLEAERIEAVKIEEARIAAEAAEKAAEEERLEAERLALIKAKKAKEARIQAEKARKKSKVFRFVDRLRNIRVEKIKEVENIKFFGYRNNDLQTWYLYKIEDINKYNIDVNLLNEIPYAHLMPLQDFYDISRVSFEERGEDNETYIDDQVWYKMAESGISEGARVSKLSPSLLYLVAEYVKNDYVDFTNCKKNNRKNPISRYYTSWYAQGISVRKQYSENCGNKIFMDLVDLGVEYAESRVTPKDFRERLRVIEDNGFTIPTLKDCFLYRYNDRNTEINDGRSVYHSFAMSTSFEDSSTFARGTNPMRIYIPEKTPVKAFPIFLLGDKDEEFEVILLDVTIMRDKYYDDIFLNHIKDTETVSYVRGEDFQNWVAISNNITENLFKPTLHHTKLNFGSSSSFV